MVSAEIICVWIALHYTWNGVLAADGGWASWSKWAPCSVSCGEGQRRRYRACTNPAPGIGGKFCPGALFQTEACEGPVECAVDGQWTEWGVWTICSVSCGEGMTHRYRSCNNPMPQHGGKNCVGPMQDSQKCFAIKNCPRDGQWSTWSHWSACSVTCGQGGSRYRYRACNNPPPLAEGAPCQGVARDVSRCSAPERCPVNGQWSGWSEWTECSTTCGSGGQTRFRNCDKPPPQHGGQDCDRSDAGELQQRSCNGTILHCPVDGGWSEWGDWGDCNTPNCQSANSSYSLRQRSCSSPLPKHNGTMCQGTFLQAGLCVHPVNCKVNGGFSEWSEWECSKFLTRRERKCDSPAPSKGGKNCTGEYVEFFSRGTEFFNEACPEFQDNDNEDNENGDNENGDIQGSGSGGGFNSDDEE